MNSEETNPNEETEEVSKSPSLPSGLHIGHLTDVGQVRERNEDSMFTFVSSVQQEYGEEQIGLFIVADGMGGHQQGDIASSIAARSTASYILENIYLPYLSSDNNEDNRTINEILLAAVEYANKLVLKEAPEGGTTLTATLVMGNSAYIVHIGDTRAYYIKENAIKQITEDHSLAQRLRQSMDEASTEELEQIDHILYKAMGQDDTIEADTYLQPLPSGSSLLLCSDGLWKGVNDDETLQETINTAASPQEACKKLVTIANENGGDDNITAIVVSIGLAEEANND